MPREGAEEASAQWASGEAEEAAASPVPASAHPSRVRALLVWGVSGFPTCLLQHNDHEAGGLAERGAVAAVSSCSHPRHLSTLCARARSS